MSATKRSLNVAVVGMGQMGVPIARNLAFKGRGSLYLQIHSRSLAKARKVCSDLSADGATCAMRIHNQYSTVTKWGDVIFTVLRDVNASRNVLLEDNNALIRNARPGQIFVDHTTVDIETSKECDFEATRRGAYFIDAPMSGSPRGVFNGQISIMCGGPQEAFGKVLPLMNMYGDQVQRMGGTGTGSGTKGITQMLVAVHSAAAAEAMTMAHNIGLENTKKLVAMLDGSWAGSTMLRRNSNQMEILLRNPGEGQAPVGTTSCDQVLHDISLLGSGCTTSLDSFPLLSASVKMLEAARNSGSGDRDLSALVQYLSIGKVNSPMGNGEGRTADLINLGNFARESLNNGDLGEINPTAIQGFLDDGENITMKGLDDKTSAESKDDGAYYDDGGEIEFY
eukprot:Tbor_TRINITY_DN4205_c0_g1::TRINITY_DN4205_c0_g1_i2::g.23838::m.23838/K00020/mmsB, HIBADH; 3-hydroxyisobutyrate dehydrogenase